MMQPSGRAMHNGKMYELWGDQLWEYTLDLDTGRCNPGIVIGTVPGNPANVAPTDSVRDAAADMLAALELWQSTMEMEDADDGICTIYVPSGTVDAMASAVAKAKRLSTPTGNPKYPDSRNGICEDSDSMHDCEADADCIHDCGTGCHTPKDKA